MSRWPDIDTRFWQRVNKTETCWIWTGQTNNGILEYGVFGKGTAHRYSYIKTFGEIPLGLEIDHLCRNTLCVRPNHLEAVTHKENMRRSMHEVGINARKIVCGLCRKPYNHVRPSGARNCKPCDNARAKRNYLKNRDEILKSRKEKYWERKSGR